MKFCAAHLQGIIDPCSQKKPCRIFAGFIAVFEYFHKDANHRSCSKRICNFMLQRKNAPEFFMSCCIRKCSVCKQHFQMMVFCSLLYELEQNIIVKVKTDQLLRFEILCSAFLPNDY